MWLLMFASICVSRLSSVYFSAWGGLGGMTSNFQSFPFKPSTSEMGEMGVGGGTNTKNKIKTLCSSFRHTAQQTKANCKAEFASLRERNQRVPQESRKMHEYRVLIFSDPFHPPPSLFFCFLPSLLFSALHRPQKHTTPLIFPSLCQKESPRAGKKPVPSSNRNHCDSWLINATNYATVCFLRYPPLLPTLPKP